ncbi:hypothetical protein EYC80_003767 [Monilinia laxa]|uniref:DUF7918 domain-containing protein n=1 Tax=Monilinia laxa TaxID=61186 RepID=A0A5N6KMK4_MONLA|nr:hypothetical protein EYC80_003767 [Monilinia laxa]
MAVLNDVRGIQVTVRVDGKALEEYDDDDVETVPGDAGEYRALRTVAKYIESCTDKNFDIKYQVDDEYKFDSPHLTFSTYVDGTKVSGGFVANRDPCYRKNTVEGLRSKFDNDLKVHRRGAKRPSHDSSLSCTKLNVDTSEVVHEKALKGRALSHSIGLGASQPISRLPYFGSKSLQSLLIIERTILDLENLNAAQKAKLQKFLGNLMGSGSSGNENKIKQGEKKIKRERKEDGSGSNANKRSSRGKRVEIDLTGDDSG